MSIGTVFRQQSHTGRPPPFGRAPTRGCPKGRYSHQGQGAHHRPIGQTWDSFFLDGPTVSDDFLPERATQHQTEREAL